MEVYSNQPGVQFYTSNGQPETDMLKGKDGFIKKHGAFCLETQNYPDAINHVSIHIFITKFSIFYKILSFHFSETFPMPFDLPWRKIPS